MLNAVLDREQPVDLLATMFKRGVLPNAFLFTGIKGIGKEKIAMRVAMVCNCKMSPVSDSTDPRAGKLIPCGVCRSCKKIAAGVHPDIISISPQGSLIKIAQIRSICDQLVLRPFEAQKRVILIKDAELMNREASNALLKVLEEPPQNTLLILTTSRSHDLLATIKSRCRRIAFSPVALATIEAYFVQNEVPKERAAVLTHMTEGSWEKANALLGAGQQAAFLKFRTFLAYELKKIVLEESPKLRGMFGLMLLAEKLSQSKERFMEALEFMQSFFRDVVIFPYAENRIIHRDLGPAIKALSAGRSVQFFLLKIKLIQKTQFNIQMNVNLRLTAEAFLMQLVRD